MRNRLLPAVACLVALGCSHRHLLLLHAPVGARAVADHAGPGWRITLMVLGTGWEVTSPDPFLAPEGKEEGDRTRIQWTVTEARWGSQQDYALTLRRGGEEVILTVRNRSREAQVAEGVAIGVAAVGLVALAVASGRGGHGGSGGHAAPKPVPRPGLKPGTGRLPTPPVRPGPVPVPSAQPIPDTYVTLSDPKVMAEPDPEPVVLLEPEDAEALPGELSSFLNRVPEGWQVGVELRFLPAHELWTVAGEGFDVAGDRENRELSATWLVSGSKGEAGRTYVLAFTGPDRVYRVGVRLQ